LLDLNIFVQLDSKKELEKMENLKLGFCRKIQIPTDQNAANWGGLIFDE